MSSHLTRRDFLVVTGGTLGALALSSCGGAGSGAGAGTVDVWGAFGTAATKKFYQQKILAPFNASHKDIQVRLSVKQIDTIDRLLQTAMAAGKGPDVVPTPGPSYASSYVAAGQFLALDALAAKHGWTDRLLPWALETGTIDGELYSIPSAYESMVILYNTGTFEKNGWTPPKTRAEFEAICQDAAQKKMLPVAAGNAEWHPATEWHVTNVLNAAAGSEALYEALNGKRPWSDPAFVDAITLLKGYFDEGWFGGGVKQYFTNKFGPLYDKLAKGEAALMVTGSWGMTEIGDYFGKAAGNTAEWDWAPLPALSDQVQPGIYPLGVGSTLSINKKASSPDHAATYIDFLMDPGLQGKGLAEAELQPYPVKLTDADFPAGVDPRLKRFYTDLGASTNVGYTTWTFWPPKSDTYVYREMDKVLLGDVTPAAYCAGLEKVFQGELKAGKAASVSKLGA